MSMVLGMLPLGGLGVAGERDGGRSCGKDRVRERCYNATHDFVCTTTRSREGR